MTPKSLSSFEHMLTSFAYGRNGPIRTAPTVGGDDSLAGGTRKQQKKTKEAATAEREKRSPAPPQTPPRSLRTGKGLSSPPQADRAAVGHGTTAAESAATTLGEAAAPEALASSSALLKDERQRQQRREFVTPAGPGTPLVLPPGKGKCKNSGSSSSCLRKDGDGKPAISSRFFRHHASAPTSGEEKARQASWEGDQAEIVEAAGEEGMDHMCADGGNKQIHATNKRKKRRKRSCVGTSPLTENNEVGGDEDRKSMSKKRQQKNVVVVSPYFTASSEQRSIEGGAGAGDEVEVVVQRRTRKKRASPAAESAAEPRTSSGRYQGCVEPVKGKRKRKRKRKVVVVSPYFTASSEQPFVEGGAGVGEEVEVVVQRRARKKRTCQTAESAAEPGTSGGRRQGCVELVEGKRKRRLQSVQLSAAERMADAYKRVPDDNPWVPPFSDHDLLQEFHFFDHWRVLVICMLLNRTTGREVQKVLRRLFLLCPDAETTTRVSEEEIEDIIRPLGLQRKRSKMIKRLSEEYLQPEWTHVTQLHGIGKYAADAYAIFCSGMWKEVKPNDHKLVDYWRFLLNDKDARKSIMVHKTTCVDQSQLQ